MRLQPTPSDRFTFGLWTVGNRGGDPFGLPVRPVLEPERAVAKLAELGAYGVNLHDNDLVPIDASPAGRDRIVASFRRAVESAGLCVPMATTNLFTDPVFRDGAFTAHDPAVRAYALQKTMNAIDLGVELGARTYVFWGGREGAEVDAAKDPVEAIKRFREAIGQGLGHDRIVIVMLTLELGNELVATGSRGDGERTDIITPSAIDGGNEIRERIKRGLSLAFPLLTQCVKSALLRGARFVVVHDDVVAVARCGPEPIDTAGA